MGLLNKAEAGKSKKTGANIGLFKRITQKKYDKTRNVSSSDKVLLDALSAEYAKLGAFQGIVIEALKNSAEEIYENLVSMVSSFAAVQKLNQQRCLVLFDAKQDKELIGFHLAKTIAGNTIFSFQARNPQEAYSYLKPYL